MRLMVMGVDWQSQSTAMTMVIYGSVQSSNAGVLIRGTVNGQTASVILGNV